MSRKDVCLTGTDLEAAKALKRKTVKVEHINIPVWVYYGKVAVLQK